MVVDSIINWIASKYGVQIAKDKNNALNDVFRITYNDIGEEIKVVINEKLIKHHFIHSKTSSRFIEGEVINYTNLIS